jgi:hypothetical protein
MPGSAGGYVAGFHILDRRGVDDLALVDDGGVARQAKEKWMFCSAISTVAPVPRSCRSNSPMRCTMIGARRAVAVPAQGPGLAASRACREQGQ